MKVLLTTLIGAIMVFGINLFVINIAWALFVVPIFGLSSLNFLQTLGLGLFLQFFSSNTKK